MSRRHRLRSALLVVVLGVLVAGCSSSTAPRSAAGTLQPEPQSVPEWLGNPQPQW
jgi:hypothetical protein